MQCWLRVLCLAVLSMDAGNSLDWRVNLGPSGELGCGLLAETVGIEAEVTRVPLEHLSVPS